MEVGDHVDDFESPGMIKIKPHIWVREYDDEYQVLFFHKEGGIPKTRSDWVKVIEGGDKDKEGSTHYYLKKTNYLHGKRESYEWLAANTNWEFANIIFCAIEEYIQKAGGYGTIIQFPKKP